MENNNSPNPPIAFATALANTHAEGAEATCYRWRFRAAIRRVALLALLMVSVLYIVWWVCSLVSALPLAIGDHTVDEIEENIRQMLLSV